MYTTKDVLKSKSERQKLEKRNEPYWVQLVRGTSLGYNSQGGSWSVRKYSGGRYQSSKLGPSDDTESGLTYTEAAKLAIRYDTKTKSPTVEFAWEQYLKYLTAHGKGIRSTTAYYKLHIAPTLNNLRLSDLTLPILEKWQQTVVSALKNDDIKIRRDSCNRITTILKAMLNKAYRDGLVENDHAWRRLERFKNVGRSRVRTLSPKEITAVLSVSPEPFRNLFLTALYTGCRYSELTRLEPEDWDGKRIHVRESKSGKPRFIPVTIEAIDFFGQIQLPLRPAKRGRWNTNTTQKYLLKIEKETGVTFRMHDLRHTYASRLLNNGAHPSVVAKLLGHSGTRMVEKHYGHLYEETINDNVNRYLGTITE